MAQEGDLFSGRAEVGIKVNLVYVSVSEGDTKYIKVWLSARPRSVVTVTLEQDNTAITLGQGALVFTPINWNATQTISITSARDTDALDEDTIVTLTAKGHRVSNIVRVLVATQDTNPAFEFEADEVEVIEGEASLIGVKLTRAPASPVTVELLETSHLVTLSVKTLSFDMDNYGTYQRVIANTITDSDNVDNPVGIICVAPNIQSRTLFLYVNEPPSVVTDLSSIAMEEATSTRLRVRLSREPTEDVTVAVTSADISKVVVSPLALSFTEHDWHTYQHVTIEALADDDDDADEIVAITLNPDGGNFDTALTVTVQINVADDDAIAPGQPRSLSTEIGDEEVKWSWNAPNVGGLVKAYEIRISTTPNFISAWTDIGNILTTTTSSLANGTLYYFQVRAKNDNNTGPSVGSSATPQASLLVPGLPHDLTAVISSAEVVWNWNSPVSGGTIASYEYRQGTSEIITSDFLDIGIVNTTTLSGLQNGVPIFFEIRARNATGVGVTAKGSATPLGLPGTPRALTSTIGSTTLEWSWEAPIGGGPVAHYEYRYGVEE